MKLSLFQVDAFTSQVFRGNPAAVVPLEAWLDARVMQAIAAENNLAETAFFVHEREGYRIRWFSPTAEVDLCGHATLASANVLFNRLEPGRAEVAFASRSGPLRVTKQGGRLVLDFPARVAVPCAPPKGLAEALGATPRETLMANDLLCVFESEEEVRALKPDIAAVARIDARGVIASAAGNDADFVSRFFVPRLGVDEDPATGSSHCTLAPYWAARLGRTALHARQVSVRGGEFWCDVEGDRVKIAGHAALYFEGAIAIS